MNKYLVTTTATFVVDEDNESAAVSVVDEFLSEMALEWSKPEALLEEEGER